MTVGSRVHWNPEQYLRFGEPRLRPALDLLARVPTTEAADVVDLGCGSGPLFPALRSYFPGARLTGVDSSSVMLAEAKGADRLVVADIGGWEEPADVIYSNSALHWVPDHEALFPRLVAAVRPAGVLAVQMPVNHDRPTHGLIEEVVRNGPWAEILEPILASRADPVHPLEFYLDVLAGEARWVEAWDTDYLHVLAGENPVAEWTRGAALRPYLTALEPGEADEFFRRYRSLIAAAYPRQPDGSTRLRFRRRFILAGR